MHGRGGILRDVRAAGGLVAAWDAAGGLHAGGVSALERHFWRNCGLGKDPMYGADMQGSLFDSDMTTWNVSCLPNLLGRLLPPGSTVPGVNTPCLHFGESQTGSTFLIANSFVRYLARNLCMACRRHGSLLDQLHPFGRAQIPVRNTEHARRRFRANDEA